MAARFGEVIWRATGGGGGGGGGGASAPPDYNRPGASALRRNAEARGCPQTEAAASSR